jgi:phosphoribosylformylglycinamidine synthase subunit PurL
LFSESTARAIAVLRPGAEAEFAALCAARGVPATTLGVTGGQTLKVTGLFEVPLAELSAVSRETLPALFG